MLLSELAKPKYRVLELSSMPLPQYCLKKAGKKPAITVVAKAEFAQSYSAQAYMRLVFPFKVDRVPQAPTVRG